jgi:hypothetical protein
MDQFQIFLLYDINLILFLMQMNCNWGKKFPHCFLYMTKPLDILKAGLQALWKLTEAQKRKLDADLQTNQSITACDEVSTMTIVLLVPIYL